MTESEGGSGNRSGRESGNGSSAGQKRQGKKKEKLRRKYAYTAMFRQPEAAKGGIMARGEVIKANKFLHSNAEEADIGSTRFHSTVWETRQRAVKVSQFPR